MRSTDEILNGMDRLMFDIRCKYDFKFFCEKMLNLTAYGGIHEFQLDWFRLAENSVNTVIEAPSSSSKTEIMGVCYTLWNLYTKNKKIEILLISKTVAQAEGNLLDRIKDYIMDNEILKTALVPDDSRVTWNKMGIKTVNQSTVKNVPFNVNIKGYRAHLIICHPPGTKIYCEKGSKDIKDIEIGDKVLTKDGSFQYVTKKMTKKTFERLYEIHAGRIKLKATRNHPIYIERNGYFLFVDAEKIRLGDKIAFPTGGRFREAKIKKIGRFKYPDKIKIDMEMAELLGYFVAEGCIRNRDIGFTFNKTETEYINRVKYLLEKYFGKVTIDEHKESSTNLFLSRIAIRDLFKRLCGHGAHNKIIPKQIMNSPNHIKFKFLEAYINGDGHWGKTGTIMATVSKKLADGLVTLLNSLGIHANKRFYNVETTFGKSNIYHVSIGVNEANAIRTWANADIGSRYLWQKVDKVKKKRAGGKVYNLQITPNNTYVANGMIVHNCDEADSYEDVDIFFNHVTSRPHPGGKIILISTPEGTTKLIGQLKEKIESSIEFDDYKFMKTTSLIHKDTGEFVTGEDITSIEDFDRLIKEKKIKPLWKENDNFSFAKLKQKFLLGKYTFFQNYLCEIIGESEDAAFPLKCIIDTYDHKLGFSMVKHENAQYFIGADFAISSGPRADFDAYIVVESLNDTYTLKYIEMSKGTQRPQKIRRLKSLYEQFYTTAGTRVVADESNMGTMVINDLRALGVTVIPQKFSGVARFELINILSNVFQSAGTLVIPKDPMNESNNKLVNELQGQLMGFKRAKTEKGNETYLSKANHDDLAISLAMAVKEAVRLNSSVVRAIYR